MRNLFAWALLGLLMLVPAAMADETKPDEPAPDEATYSDCPPDAEVCAYGAEDCIECSGMSDPPQNGTDEPTYGDCGAEMCAYDGGGSDGSAGNGTDGATYGECRPEATVCALGPDDCIECMGPIESHQGSCMDGTATDCRDDVQYLDGRGPADCENCRGEEVDQAGDDAKAAPVWTPLVIVAMLGLALVMNRSR